MELRIEPRAYDDAAVVALVAAVQAEYVEIYGGHDDDPTDATSFRPPQGAFLLAWHDGAPVGMGGFRVVNPGVAEIKRMYVRADVRGHGVGRRLLEALEAVAQVAGIRRFVLNTGNRQPVAIRLYETSGYRPAEAYGYYADESGARFFAKDLTPDGADDAR